MLQMESGGNRRYMSRQARLEVRPGDLPAEFKSFKQFNRYAPFKPFKSF